MGQLTIHLSILLFWPLALALLGATIGRRVAPAIALLGSLVPLGYAIVLLIDFDTGRAGLQYVTDDAWIEALGIRYKLGLDGLNMWLVALTTLLFAAAALWVVLRPVERPRLFTFHLALAETAVLGAFLAQDLALFVLFFDLMLVPFYFLVGQWGSGAPRGDRGGDLQADHLHARRLAADARRRGRDGGALGRRRHGLVRALGPRAGRPRGVDPALDLRRVRARVPDQDADVPVPRLDARRLPRDAAAGAGDLLRGALEGGRLRLPAHRAAALPGRRAGLPDADPRARAAARSSTARRRPSRRPTRGSCSATPRSPSSASSCSASSRSTPRAAAARARCCRWSTTGSWWRRCSSSSRCSPSARTARRTSATWAAWPSARRCSRRCS